MASSWSRSGGTFLTMESQEITGSVQVVDLAEPPAAKEWAYVVPAGQRMRLVGGTAMFRADGTTGARNVAAVIRRGFDESKVAMSMCGSSINAGAYDTVCYASSWTAGNCSSGVYPVPLPPVWMWPGWVIASLTDFKGAGDQYSLISLMFEVASA